VELLARDSLRIVHVDNDDDFVELNTRGLKRAGFCQPVTRCSDGLLALRHFSIIEPQLAPHVILLDLHMPGMNGLEVLDWVRRNYNERDVAVYLLTSSEDPEHKKQATANRVTEYLLKESSVDTLIQKLDELIATCNLQKKERVSGVPETSPEPATMGLASFFVERIGSSMG
jgi:CheY-like chemotaxis protein